MSEEAAAPASEAPAPAPEAPNPAGPGGAPAPEIGTPQPSAAPQQQPAQPAPPSWQANLPEDTRGFIQNKGWESPEDIIGAYRNLERHVGKKPLTLPQSEEDQTGWDQVYEALGRPGTPDDYELTIPDGSPEDFANAARDVFHEQGLSQKQAAAIVDWYNEASQNMGNEALQQLQQQGEADLEALQKEWGKEYDQKVARAQQAANYFELDADALNSIELGQPLGAGRLLRLLANIGETMAEDRMIDGDGGPSAGFGMTPEAAKSKISELKGSAEFRTRMSNGDPDAKRQWDDLHKVAFPGVQSLD